MLILLQFRFVAFVSCIMLFFFMAIYIYITVMFFHGDVLPLWQGKFILLDGNASIFCSDALLILQVEAILIHSNVLLLCGNALFFCELKAFCRIMLNLLVKLFFFESFLHMSPCLSKTMFLCPQLLMYVMLNLIATSACVCSLAKCCFYASQYSSA